MTFPAEESDMDNPNLLTGYRLIVPSKEALQSLDRSHPAKLRLGEGRFQSAVERISTENPSVEDLAGYHLWWRGSLLFHDVVALLDSRAILTMSVLTRALFECNLHIDLLLGSGRSARRDASPFDVLRECKRADVIRYRLRGYLTWILKNEIWALKQSLRSKVSRAIFEPETARQFAGDLARTVKDFPQITELFQTPETWTDAEAEVERKNYLAIRRIQLDMVRRLYGHGGLHDWRHRLDEWPTGPVSLADMLNGSPSARTSIRGALDDAGNHLEQAFYDQASAMVHGSRLFPAAEIAAEGLIAPAIGAIGDAQPAEDRMVSAALLVACKVETLTALALAP